MRPHLLFALAALASFGAGWMGSRVLQSDDSRVAAQPAALAEKATLAAPPATADASPAGSKARIAAVFALGEKPRGLAEDHALFLALSRLEARDFPASAEELLALVKATSDTFSNPQAALCEAWMDRWLEIDAAGALRFLETSPFLGQFSTGPSYWRVTHHGRLSQSGMLKALARRQPEWMQKYLSAQKPGARRDLGAYLLLSEIAEQDPARAKLLLAALGDGVNRQGALRGYVAGLIAADVRASFSTALAEPAGPLREELLQAVMNGAAKSGLGTVRELIDRIDDPALRRKVASSGLAALPSVSREDPLPWIIEESQRKGVLGGANGDYDEWSSAVASAVTSANAAPAADWAATLGGDSEKKMLTTILARWEWPDPPGLRAWLTSHAGALEPAIAEKLGNTLKEMLRRDPATTRAWAEALPAGALREQARFQIALSAGAEGDVKQAAAMYESVAASDTTGALAKQLAIVLAKQDGAAAANWALQRPAGPARTAALETAADQWSQRDLRGVAEWLGQMAPGPDRDLAVRMYAAKAVFADPAVAAEWIEQVADPAARAKAAEQVFFTWSHEDPIAARSWLRALPGVEETWRADFLRKQK